MYLSRRRLLALGFRIGLSSSGLGLLAGQFLLRGSYKDLLKYISPEFLDHRLGSIYAESGSSTLTRQEIHRHLCAKFSQHGKLLPWKLNEAVRDAISHDYQHGRVIVLRGWVLPETAVYLGVLAIPADRNVY